MIRETRLQRIRRDSRTAELAELCVAFAHELAQPLSAIGGNAATALEVSRACEYSQCVNAEVLQDILLDVKRLREVFERIRAMTRRDSLRSDRTNVDELVSEVASLMQNDVSAQGVVLIVECSAPTVSVMVDPVQIQQILFNLVSNAIESLTDSQSQRRTIRIRTFLSEPGRVSIDVEDSGPGIAPENEPMLFHGFFTTKSNGTGVGLRLAKSMAEANKGTLTLESHGKGTGAIFRLTLAVI